MNHETLFRVQRRRRHSTAARRHASPEIVERSAAGRPKHRSITRAAPHLLSPWSIAILIAILAVSGYRIWTVIEMSRLERRLAIPRLWPAITTGLPSSGTATLTTSYEGGFLHYRFTVTPGAADKAAMNAVEAASFTLRLVDPEGFTLLVFRPDELAVDSQKERKTLQVEDVVGSSPTVYGAATKWLVTWEGG